ncbi:hypothetical protein NDU88_003299 [Pleurodeles waltl]|uniref:Uncharacterized protein n=1 Tax=Pleurodeles waltl TaxID=8319 RepID=A0AAV7TPA5_PLEWA|nr:hypothetical protein NDU88_003299 [Pleurodeles waltl]
MNVGCSGEGSLRRAARSASGVAPTSAEGLGSSNSFRRRESCRGARFRVLLTAAESAACPDQGYWREHRLLVRTWGCSRVEAPRDTGLLEGRPARLPWPSSEVLRDLEGSAHSRAPRLDLGQKGKSRGVQELHVQHGRGLCGRPCLSGH